MWAAEIARDNGVTVYTIAMGDPEAAGEQALDVETLRAVAVTTGGGYYHAGDRSELEQVYAELDRLTPRRVESLSYRPEQELYYWPLGFAIVLSLLFFGLAELRSRLQRVPRAATSGTGP